MIYILAGIAKSGKTTIAKEFNKRFNIPYFSTDYIMMMLNRGNPSLMIDPEEGDPIVAKKLEPYVYGMLKTMIENKGEYLIEGVHFNPDFSAKLIKEFPNDIKIVYLGFKDTSVVMKIFELNKYKEELENAWYKSFSDEEMVEFISQLIDDSKRVYEMCKSYNLEYIEVFDLNSQINEIVNKLYNTKF